MSQKATSKRRSLGDATLSEKLEGWRVDAQGNPEFKELADDAFETAKESYGFDHAAPATQNGQCIPYDQMRTTC